MKKVYVVLMALPLCFVSCKEETKNESSVSVETDTLTIDTLASEEASTPEMPMDSAAVQKAWEEYMTPGKVHKMLAEETGSWTNEMTFWMQPNAEPFSATSTAEIEMLFGGRYQQIKYQGDMGGMPFQGMATVAYDNETNEIISTWIDNMGTGMLVLRGKYDGEGDAITTNGFMVDPATGKQIEVREVYTIVDENTRKMEMFYTPENGEEFKSMQIVMTRN